MAKVTGLRGLRYNSTRFASQMSSLVAAPYDVVTEEDQAELYARHPNNIIRVDLNHIHSGDYDQNNRYTRARRHLMDWLARGVLITDPEPCLYVHHQTFDDGRGGRVTRRGFIGLVGLADYEEGVVLPHERTLRGPKADRFELMKATECNLSQVFLLYKDTESLIDSLLDEAIAGLTPVVDISTPDGIDHQLWVVQDAALEARVASFFEQRSLLIADGHHRYETSLAYRDFRREVEEDGVEPDAPYESFMAFMVNMHDPGLLVFPTHRVVHGLSDFDGAALIERLTEDELFEVTALDSSCREDGQALIDACERAGASAPSFVLVAEGVESPQLVTFKGDEDAPIFDEETPAEVRALDVAVLHEGIFDRILGIDKAAQEAKTNLHYKKKLSEAMAELDDPNTQLLVIMNATPVEQIDRVCRSGGKMPQKSTYFYPKILSGLVINLL